MACRIFSGRELEGQSMRGFYYLSGGERRDGLGGGVDEIETTRLVGGG